MPLNMIENNRRNKIIQEQMEQEWIVEDNCKNVKICLFPYSYMIIYYFISWVEFKALNDMTEKN